MKDISFLQITFSIMVIFIPILIITWFEILIKRLGVYCPTCNSKKVRRVEYTLLGDVVIERYKCKECDNAFTFKYNI